MTASTVRLSQPAWLWVETTTETAGCRDEAAERMTEAWAASGDPPVATISISRSETFTVGIVPPWANNLVTALGEVRPANF